MNRFDRNYVVKEYFEIQCLIVVYIFLFSTNWNIYLIINLQFFKMLYQQLVNCII